MHKQSEKFLPESDLEAWLERNEKVTEVLMGLDARFGVLLTSPIPRLADGNDPASDLILDVGLRCAEGVSVAIHVPLEGAPCIQFASREDVRKILDEK